MKYWFDTEFIEDGRTIDLLSIGVVSEDGRQFYAEPAETDRSRASPWVVENVLPHLKPSYVYPRAVIRERLLVFMGDRPEIWAYYADYDWVVLCQLFGTMMDLPEHWPRFCRDVKQLAAEQGDPELPPQLTQEHNALADANWCRDAYYFLRSPAGRVPRSLR